MECESTTESLPDEVWLMIFRFLSVDQLLIAEQVCVRWKAIVNTCFATARELALWASHDSNALQKIRRHGPSLKSIQLSFTDGRIDWIHEIGNAFPNLLSISLVYVPISQDNFKDLLVKLPKLVKISLLGGNLTDDEIGILIKAFPRLKYLGLASHRCALEECFRELGSNVEHLNLGGTQISKVGTSHIFSRCTNLKTLKIDEAGFQIDYYNFNRFCKKSLLRTIKIGGSSLSKEGFLSMSQLSLLEHLQIVGCDNVDSDVLIAIIRGCPNLKNVQLAYLEQECERGLKALAQCRHLTQLELFSLQDVTDESLVEIAKCGLLETLTIDGGGISDRGLSAILAQCPRLAYLDVNNCGAVSDSTVDAAIQAVESRRSASGNYPSLRAKPIEILLWTGEPVRSFYLLTLVLQVEALKRYEDGFSHPLLSLQIYY